MKNILMLILVTLGGLLQVYAQNDPRDNNYTPPASLNLIYSSVTSSNSNLSGDFNMLLKFHPMELLRGQLLFSFEKSIGRSSSLELFVGQTRNINTFGAGNGFGSGIVREFIADFSDNSQLPSDLLQRGTFVNAFRPAFGLGLKFFDDSDTFDNALRTIQVFYRFSSAKLDLPGGYDSEDRIIRADSRQTSLSSNEIGVRYGLQFIHFKKPKLSNEIGLSLSLNIVTYDVYEFVTPQSGNYYREYIQMGSKDNTSYPSIRLYYNIGLGL